LAWGEKFLKKDHHMARNGDDKNGQHEKRGKALRGRAGRMQGGRGSGRSNKGPVRLWGRHASRRR
jgi:23S rRNA (guanosine2251-2'-O)-methyltransferase